MILSLLLTWSCSYSVFALKQWRFQNATKCLMHEWQQPRKMPRPWKHHMLFRYLSDQHCLAPAACGPM